MSANAIPLNYVHFVSFPMVHRNLHNKSEFTHLHLQLQNICYSVFLMYWVKKKVLKTEAFSVSEDNIFWQLRHLI